jgi:hypothetical protein
LQSAEAQAITCSRRRVIEILTRDIPTIPFANAKSEGWEVSDIAWEGVAVVIIVEDTAWNLVVVFCAHFVRKVKKLKGIRKMRKLGVETYSCTCISDSGDGLFGIVVESHTIPSAIEDPVSLRRIHFCIPNLAIIFKGVDEAKVVVAGFVVLQVDSEKRRSKAGEDVLEPRILLCRIDLIDVAETKT